MRRLYAVNWLVTVLFTCGCCVESRRQQEFEQLYGTSLQKPDLATIDKLQAYYPELANKLPAEYYKVRSILSQHDEFSAAAKLVPLFEKSSGDARLCLADLLITFSHGYCAKALGALEQERMHSPDLAPLAKTAMGRAEYFDKHRGSFEVEEALRCDVPLHIWHSMSKEVRWRHVVGARGRSETRGDELDANSLVQSITVENWWHILSANWGWDTAMKLSPYLDTLRGERRCLVAILVGVCSAGLHEKAIGILKKPDVESSPAVAALCLSIERCLDDIQRSYDPVVLLRQLGGVRGVSRWSEMTRDERWNAIVARIRELKEK